MDGEPDPGESAISDEDPGTGEDGAVMEETPILEDSSSIMEDYAW